jgi:hypothetical protein
MIDGPIGLFFLFGVNNAKINTGFPSNLQFTIQLAGVHPASCSGASTGWAPESSART